MYTNLNMIFYEFIMVEENFDPQQDSLFWMVVKLNVRCLPNPEQGGNEPRFYITNPL